MKVPGVTHGELARDARRGRITAVAVLVGIAPVLLAPQRPAIAQPAAAASGAVPVAGQDTKVAAQALFEDAMLLRKKGAIAEACAKLDESLRLDPAPGTKFYLAECMEQTGKLASAWLLYTEVADAMAVTGQQKREAFARERSAALAPKLARLQINVPSAARVPGLVVRRDGVVLGEAQWSFAAPVDFGKHTIEATAPGAQPFKQTVDVREAGHTVTVEVPALSSSLGEAAATCPTIATSAPGIVRLEPQPFLKGSLRVAGVTLGGIGVAGLVAGGVLGALALDKQRESNTGPCDLARDVCDREGLSLRADAITAATGSTIAFVAGGTLLAAGVVLLVLPTKRPAPTAVVVRPNGLALEGRW